MIKVDNPNFKRECSYEISLVGKTMSEWVSLALGGCPFSVICRYGEDFVPHVSEQLDTDTRYTVVLYSDTPLVQKNIVLEAVRTCEQQGVQAMRLTRGWVFETEYLAGLTELPQLKRQYLSDEEGFMTCADFSTLALVTNYMRSRIINYHMEHGVHIVDPSNTYIDGDVVIAEGVTVQPGNSLRGRTVIGAGVTLEEGNVLSDSVIAEGARIMESRIEHSFVGANSVIGPKSYLRPGCMVGENCKVGDYVELKKTKLGDGTHVAHLAYLGDCETGKNCNIGGGVITANYDGVRKFKTLIGNHVFVGSNSTLVAPLKLGDNAFIAAGSIITEEVASNALAIARARQTNLTDRSKW